MPVNISAHRVAEVSDLPVKSADGAPLVDDQGNAVTATVFGPGTKIWQVANATMRRVALKRTREAGGKIEAAFDGEDDDKVEFLCAITKRFNNLTIDGVEGDREIVRAVYSDPRLGFIRDHMETDTKNWGNFMKASQALSSSGSASSPG